MSSVLRDDRGTPGQHKLWMCLLLLLPMPAFAQAAEIIGFIAVTELAAFGVASVCLIAMLVSRKTRMATIYPLAVASLFAAPLGMFFSGMAIPNRATLYLAAMQYISPWVFVVGSLVTFAVVKYTKAASGGDSCRNENTGSPVTIWTALNVALPIVIAINKSLPAYSLWWLLHSIPEALPTLTTLNGLIVEMQKRGGLPLYVCVNYGLAPWLLAKVFMWANVRRWLSPDAYGAGILLIASVGEFAALAVQLWIVPVTENYGLDDIVGMYVWPLRILALAGYLVMVVSTHIPKRPSEPVIA